MRPRIAPVFFWGRWQKKGWEKKENR